MTIISRLLIEPIIAVMIGVALFLFLLSASAVSLIYPDTHDEHGA